VTFFCDSLLAVAWFIYKPLKSQKKITEKNNSTPALVSYGFERKYASCFCIQRKMKRIKTIAIWVATELEMP